MKYNFNWSAVSGGAPYVTVSSISIAFNSVSIEKLGAPEKVVVGFDEENCIIGIREYRGEPGMKPFTFAERVKHGWVRIGCRDFIKYLQALSGIEFFPAKKYVATYDIQEGVLIVDVRGQYENTSGEESGT
jgi:hypothetical protein